MVSIDVLTAVHHPVRRRIIDHLVLHGPSQVGTLAQAFGEQVGSISHHLRMLERVDVVERAPELATDGRTSWWRYKALSISWSPDDFSESPADLYRARAAEKLNFEHQVAKFVGWKRRSGSFSPEWRRAAYSSDSLAKATPDELERPPRPAARHPPGLARRDRPGRRAGPGAGLPVHARLPGRALTG